MSVHTFCYNDIAGAHHTALHGCYVLGEIMCLCCALPRCQRLLCMAAREVEVLRPRQVLLVKQDMTQGGLPTTLQTPGTLRSQLQIAHKSRIRLQQPVTLRSVVLEVHSLSVLATCGKTNTTLMNFWLTAMGSLLHSSHSQSCLILRTRAIARPTTCIVCFLLPQMESVYTYAKASKSYHL